MHITTGGTFGFRDQILGIIKNMKATVQCTFVTATIPEPIFLDLQSLFTNITLVAGPALHRSAPGKFSLRTALRQLRPPVLD